MSFSLSDPVHAIGAIENLTLTGSADIDGTGNALANTIIGNAGNNVLAGLGGADVLDGGAGIDTASYAASPSGVSVSLMTGVGSGGDAEGDTLINIENLTGSAFNDTLIGNAGNNVLAGLGGADILDGGAGIDTASYAASNAGVSVSLATGVGSGGDAEGDTLVNIENLTGSAFNDTLTGDANTNVLIGLAGNDILNGGAGADIMQGGLGNDTYVVDNVGDVVDETGGDGLDTVQSSVSFSLADPVHAIGAIENLTLTGSADINGTGNALANTIIGNAGNNVLIGGAGTDTVSYENSVAGVTVSLAVLAAQNTIGAGTDTLSGFENLTGSAFNDTLTGDANTNVLIGLGGNDTLERRGRRRSHAGRVGQRHLRGRQRGRRGGRDGRRRPRHGAVVGELQSCRPAARHGGDRDPDPDRDCGHQRHRQ